MSITPQSNVMPPITSNFDPLLHRPPKFDIYGKMVKQTLLPGEDPRNILKDKEKIVVPWNKPSTTGAPMTRTKLLENRKLGMIPDISYDLDKDGYVGGKDYVLAKRFDFDGDGKLNEQEKKYAYEMINKGYEDNFVWNVENRGNKGESKDHQLRILQKRGKIIDAEDFLPIRETYPEHPLTKVKPHLKSFQELKDKRRMETKKFVDDKVKKWEEANPTTFVNEPQDPSMFYKPKYTSMKQIRKDNHVNARMSIGLLPEETDIKVTNKDPGLNYVRNPKHRTMKDIKAELKQESHDQFNKLGSNTYKDDVERLYEREEEIFADGYSKEDKKTFNQIKEKRRLESLEYNLKTFSKQTIGVHGHELPKFAESEELKEYWKNREGYNPNPKVNSHIVYKENVKYWKKPEELLIKDHQDDAPLPPKKEYVLKEQKDNLIIKVNNLNLHKGFDPNNPKPIDLDNPPRNHIYKWTRLVQQFAPQKFKNGRYFDNLKNEDNLRGDLDKVYSSFAGGLNESLSPAIVNKQIDNISKKIDNDKLINDNMANPAKDTLFQKFGVKDNVVHKNIDNKTKSVLLRTKGF